MRKVKIGKFDIELYDSIEELPILRFHKYNKMLLVDSGIGSDLSDFDLHIEKAVRFIKSKSPELALQELDNLRQNVYMIQSGISPKHLSFCCLIKSVDGVEKNDLSDSGLTELLNIISDMPNKETTDLFESVKKKIDDELLIYFPSMFDDSVLKEYYTDMQSRTLLILDGIINGLTPDKEKEIEDITNLLLMYNKPKKFNGRENVEIDHDRHFENMCLIISQHLHIDAKRYSVLEYFNAFEYIKKMIKGKNYK